MPGPFRILHRWVYDMDVTLSSDTIFGVLDAARKYMVEDLELTCRRWIALEARSATGAVGLFCAAVAGQWIPWSQALRARVESFGAAALAACPEAISRLPADAFMSLLTSEDLSVAKEEEIFDAVQGWAAAASERSEELRDARERGNCKEGTAATDELPDIPFFAEKVVLPQTWLGRLTQDRFFSFKGVREHVCSETVEKGAKPVGVCVQSDGRLPGSAIKPTGKAPEPCSQSNRLQLILRDCSYEERRLLGAEASDDTTSIIDSIIELRHEDTYPRTLAHCLVQKALADYEHCSEWVSMWTELWGALRAAGLRDECVRATVDYCQNLFEEEPSPENLVGVWICPHDTLGLVRVLCNLNDSRKLAVLPLMKVLEALVHPSASFLGDRGGSVCL
ncbi:unnamed protein product [Durusdinium trenchii]|uniref:BACK domain-containing protein n=1 Tax=Durusdinium trenchii TaxID=1381693 RepID=A0ABP0NSB3_9DINO